MVTERLEVRLDPEHKRKLNEIAEKEQLPVAAAVRRLIDQRYEEFVKERRLKAAEELNSLCLDMPEDPEDLREILLQTHDPNYPDPLY
jgi:hypothetical protein